MASLKARIGGEWVDLTSPPPTATLEAELAVSETFIAPEYGPFVDHPNNPLIYPVALVDDPITAFGSVWKDGSTYYYYYMYVPYPLTTYHVGRATSPDGITWTKDTANNPLLSPTGGSNWDANGAAVPTVWKEGSTWYMLYRGLDSTSLIHRGGLATSTNGIAWTRVPSTVAVTGDGCILDRGLLPGGTDSLEPYGCIKVGDTYYVGVDNPGGATRAAGIAYGTDLSNLTKHPSNPLYTGGKYCTAIIKIGSYFYQFVNSLKNNSTMQADIEVYRDTSPIMLPTTRRFLGQAWQTPGDKGIYTATNAGGVRPNQMAYAADTICFLTDDIYRNSYTLTGGDLWMYFSTSQSANHSDFATVLAISSRGPGFVARPAQGIAIDIPYLGIKTVAQLNVLVSAAAGAKAYASDATVTHAAGIGTQVVGGGSNFVPVHLDNPSGGATKKWLIG
jgi:hypothetical protein